MIDLKTHSKGSLALFRAACKNQIDDVMPLSAAEEQLAEWSDMESEIFDGRKFSPGAIGNLSLIMGIWARNFARERLSGIEETNNTLVIKLDFAHVSGVVSCQIELSKAEAEEILQDPSPFKRAIKITDTRFQRAMYGKIASLDLDSIVSENLRQDSNNLQKAGMQG